MVVMAHDLPTLPSVAINISGTLDLYNQCPTECCFSVVNHSWMVTQKEINAFQLHILIFSFFWCYLLKILKFRPICLNSFQSLMGSGSLFDILFREAKVLWVFFKDSTSSLNNVWFFSIFSLVLMFNKLKTGKKKL